MENKRDYLVFMSYWRMYKEILTLEQWYELEDYIFKYEFDNYYTNPDEIKDLTVKCAWIGISEYMGTEEYCSL